MNFQGRRQDGLVLGTFVLLLLPTLVFTYLPATDLPQHSAITAMLVDIDNPEKGYSEYFEIDLKRTMYLLPYALSMALASILPLSLAMAVWTLLGVAALPLGLFCVLRALGKPTWLLLLAAPLCYNRAFFWGFTPFLQGIGLALAAISYICLPKLTKKQQVALLALSLATTFSHPHGIALLLLFAALRFLTEPGWPVLKRLVPVFPAVLLLPRWLWISYNAQGTVTPSHGPGFLGRIILLENSILGGYWDHTEEIILGIFAVLVVVLTYRTAPVTRRRVAALGRSELALWLLFALNVVFYFTLPKNTANGAFIHFRNALIAASLLPLLCVPLPHRLIPLSGVALAVGAIFTAWLNMGLFNHEAGSLTPLRSQIPKAPKLLGMMFDYRGRVTETPSYLHFGGYVQAEQGGFLSSGFQRFWNIPVAFRKDRAFPKDPGSVEWHPERYDDRISGGFYDYALARLPGNAIVQASPSFPFTMVARSGPWQLYKRVVLQKRDEKADDGDLKGTFAAPSARKGEIAEKSNE